MFGKFHEELFTGFWDILALCNKNIILKDNFSSNARKLCIKKFRTDRSKTTTTKMNFILIPVLYAVLSEKKVKHYRMIEYSYMSKFRHRMYGQNASDDKLKVSFLPSQLQK